MKRIFYLLLILVMILAAGCSQADNTQSAPSALQEVSAASAEDDGTSGDSQTLVVFFSGTGHTAEVADTIAKAENADVFELIPEEPYSAEDLDWSDENSRVVREYENPDERQIELTQTAVPDWEKYDTVFFGYPIWWQDAAWPVFEFVQTNDFTGKNIIPFCTSSSTGIEASVETLQEMAGSGNWQEGQRFSAAADPETVQEWLETLSVN